MAETGRPGGRPLSPHLFIYRPMLTMMMSILHRLTGAALYFGTALLAWFLLAASIDVTAFSTASWVLRSIPGQIVLFGFTWALMQHFMGGLRHALWDHGVWMDHPQREWLARATLWGGIALTALVWCLAWLAG